MQAGILDCSDCARRNQRADVVGGLQSTKDLSASYRQSYGKVRWSGINLLPSQAA